METCDLLGFGGDKSFELDWFVKDPDTQQLLRRPKVLCAVADYGTGGHLKEEPCTKFKVWLSRVYCVENLSCPVIRQMYLLEETKIKLDATLSRSMNKIKS